jgi:hypothetical protein
MESLTMLALIVDIAVVLIAAYLVWDFARAYKAAIGNTFQRAIAALKGAAASLWTGFTVIVAVAAGWLAELANLVNAPGVAGAITTYAQPKIVAAVMIGSAIIIEWARRARGS